MKEMRMRMLLLMMMAFGLTKEEHDGSDASGNDDSGSDSSDSESDFAGSSDSDGQATKRKLHNKGQKAAKKQKKGQKATAKQRNRATGATAVAAPAAASAPANDGYLLRRLRHRRRSPLRAVGSAARVVQAIGGSGLDSRRPAHLVGAYAGQGEESRLQRLPIRD